MRSLDTVKCPICGTIFEGSTLDDCPLCDWEYATWDVDTPDDDPSDVNHGMTKREAKEKFAKGLNMWGKPLKDASDNK